MTAPPPRRPWWKRKRTAVAGLLALASFYPLSCGPAFYVWRLTRPGPISQAAADYTWPLLELDLRLGRDGAGWERNLRGPIAGYLRWFADLGKRHAASD